MEKIETFRPLKSNKRVIFAKKGLQYIDESVIIFWNCYLKV